MPSSEVSSRLEALQPEIAGELNTIREAVLQVNTSDNLLDYLQRLVAFTRQSPEFAVGLSPRGALALLDCARTWAVMNNRGHDSCSEAGRGTGLQHGRVPRR